MPRGHDRSSAMPAPPPRVAVNVQCLLSPLTGIGQYTRHLMQSISARGGFDLNYFSGHSWGRQPPDPASLRLNRLKRIAKRLLPNPHELSRRIQRIEFAWGARKLSCDLYHDPNFLPYDFPGPIVTTVHDLSVVRCPEMHPKPRRQLMEKYFPGALERSRCIITDSVFVRDELVEVLGTPPAKIHPIYLGVSENYHPRTVDDTEAVLSAHGLVHGRYVLAVGTLEPRKNLIQGLRAFRGLPETLRESMPFVIVGMKGWLTEGIEAEISALAAKGQVRPLGYLSDEALQHLYAGAAMLVYPSIYEGFGLPALEAMASGIPVITSDRSSLPEVVGDVGITVDPADVEGLAEAMRRLAEDPGERTDRGMRGLERARGFSWAHCAEETERVYRIALAAT
jgi:glycosyltransferase involved in cell wall biosynthesis